MVSYEEQQHTRTLQHGKQMTEEEYKRDHEIMSACHSFGLNWQRECDKCSVIKTLSDRNI